MEEERKHAILSASSAHRWLVCTPSAQLEEEFPEEESEYAKEGTVAHSLADLRLRKKLKVITAKEYNQLFKEEIEPTRYYNQEMDEAVNLYVDYILKIKKKHKGCVVVTEEKIDFSKYVPEGFGTADAVLVYGDTVEVIDLKYGKGVKVSAVDNPQIRLYALGTVESLGMLYDFQKVKMTIFQPRIDGGVSTEEMLVEELEGWGKSIKEKAQTAHRGEGEFVAGDHCGLCKARHVCKKRSEYALELMKNDFSNLDLVTDEQIEGWLPLIDNTVSFLNDVKEYALSKALTGKKWAGFKVVEGKSNRKYIDQDEVQKRLVSAGYEEALITERRLLSITAMEKAIGKKEFKEQLADLVVKPKGKPTLVPESDKRPEYTDETEFEILEEEMK